MPDVPLSGCRSQPLLSYLKALGVFRLVAEQIDPHARTWWERVGHAILRSALDAEALERFLLDEYRPSAITSPWNGGSGYYREPAHREAVAVLEAVEHSTGERLERLRATISAGRLLLDRLGGEGAATGEAKERLLREWRASAPEEALAWLDAALVLTDSGLAANPLLGSGGNDGRLDFSKTFLGCLPRCLPLGERWPDKEREAALGRLRVALFEADYANLAPVAVGQFYPAGSGLPNTTSAGGEPKFAANPWDVVLMTEGALLYAGGVARRLGDQEALFPFTSPARGVARLGRSLAREADADVRGEIWLPLWSQPVGLPALRRLLAEGRAQDDRAQARSGRAISRAVATLGVDRGIDAFERVVYTKRFGRSYVAVPVGRAAVRASRQAELQRAADRWLDRARRVSTASVRDAVARVDAAAHQTALGAPGAGERWLLALWDAQLAVARQARLRDPAAALPPLGGLPARVGRLADDGSPEFRLARALAAVGRGPGEPDPVAVLRALVEPVRLERGGRLIWHGETPPGRGLPRRPLELLVAVARTAPVAAGDGARLGDVRAFLAGRVDETRLVRMALALALCRPLAPPERTASRRARGLSRLYAAAYLAARAGEAARPGGAPAPVHPAPLVVPALAGGAVRRAAILASARLRADALAPYRALEAVDASPAEAFRVAAALAFPVHAADRPALEAAALMPAPEPEGAIQ